MNDSGRSPHLAENNKYTTANICHWSELKETAPQFLFLGFQRLQSCMIHDLLAIWSWSSLSRSRRSASEQFVPTHHVHTWLLFACRKRALRFLPTCFLGSLLFDLLKRMRPRMHRQCRTGQHHVIIACCARIGQLGADPGWSVHVDSVTDPVC